MQIEYPEQTELTAKEMAVQGHPSVMCLTSWVPYSSSQGTRMDLIDGGLGGRNQPPSLLPPQRACLLLFSLQPVGWDSSPWAERLVS